MIDFPGIRDLCQQTPSKIVFLVVDGLGGLPDPETGRSELEVAHLPNLDRLAQQSACGLTTPVLPGIAPGSGPGHLALFGYDPLKYQIGRGVLEALGIGVELGPGDVAARGNFCTVDSQGAVVDRRAGRISSAESDPLCQRLDALRLPGVEARVYPVRDHRFVLVLRGDALAEEVSETDPQRVGMPPLEAQALTQGAERTARAVQEFVAQARKVLSQEKRANMVLLRGFSLRPVLPSMAEAYRLNPAAIAAYPMYRGLAHLLGMHVLPSGTSFPDELATLRQHYQGHDFLFLHYKPADTAGEDGDFAAKVQALEALDRYLPQVVELAPDVLVVAGDHATPAVMGGHSWHPVPFLLHSRWTKGEGAPAFTERACAQGSLGRIPATSAMLLALAHAGKLNRFGP